MMHLRQTIRQSIVSSLTGLTTTGANVFTSRVYALPQVALPALCIFTKGETAEYQSLTRPRTIERTLELTVEIYVAANQNADNTIDRICDEIETKISENVTIDGNAKDIIVSSVDVDFDGDGEIPVARATMVLGITYFNEEGNQTVPK
jgi:hypothetical protein